MQTEHRGALQASSSERQVAQHQAAATVPSGGPVRSIQPLAQRRGALYEARGALPRRRPDSPKTDNIPAWEKG